jgi:CelD/BcsL family acetyltransferase involved in cellulose biosynthesis
VTLTVRELGSVVALESLADAWRELLTRVADDSPYVTPEFMIPWARMLADRYRLCLLCVHDGDRLVAIAPLFERRLAKWGVGFVLRSFPLYGLSPPFDLVVDPGVPQAFDALLRHLCADRRWDLLELLNVASNSPNTPLLREACRRHGLGFEAQPSLTTTQVCIQGTWAAYLAGRSRHLRKTVRQGQRRLMQQGELRCLRCPQDGVALADGIAMAMAVIAHSWKRFDAEPVDWAGFLGELGARLLRHDMLCLRFLMVGDRPVAYQLEIAYRGDLHGLHNAYDLADSDYAPGAVLLADALREAHESGCGRFDFLGTKQYLDRWAEGEREYQRLRITRAGPLSRLKLALYDRVSRARKARAEQDEEAQRLARLGRVADGDAGQRVDS